VIEGVRRSVDETSGVPAIDTDQHPTFNIDVHDNKEKGSYIFDSRRCLPSGVLLVVLGHFGTSGAICCFSLQLDPSDNPMIFGSDQTICRSDKDVQRCTCQYNPPNVCVSVRVKVVQLITFVYHKNCRFITRQLKLSPAQHFDFYKTLSENSV
jgi:hypothetical protein